MENVVHIRECEMLTFLCYRASQWFAPFVMMTFEQII